jgi:hypothetical protein
VTWASLDVSAVWQEPQVERRTSSITRLVGGEKVSRKNLILGGENGD